MGSASVARLLSTVSQLAHMLLGRTIIDSEPCLVEPCLVVFLASDLDYPAPPLPMSHESASSILLHHGPSAQS